MKTKISLVIMLALALTLPVHVDGGLQVTGRRREAMVAPARPEGPCDIYAAAGTPCVAAHSTTRALYAAYNGPLYQVMRQSDGKTMDIGVVQPSATDGGRIRRRGGAGRLLRQHLLLDHHAVRPVRPRNHLTQAPRGPAGTAHGHGWV